MKTLRWALFPILAALAASLSASHAGAHAKGNPEVASESRAAPDVFALIVGYNGGRDDLPNLRFADDDAARFALFLRSLARAPEQVVLLTTFDEGTRKELGSAGLPIAPDGPPTREGVAAAFAKLGERLAARPPGTPPPVFFFVYAGHGVQGRVLLAPHAGEEAGLTGLELRHHLAALDKLFTATAHGDARLPAFVFLDACRSQSLFLERGGGPTMGPDLTSEAATLTEEAENLPLGIMTAAVAGQATGEMAALGGGLFSHVLASGLAGAADANADQRVSFAELAAFVAFNTGQPATRQPWFAPPQGRLDTTVLDLRAARSKLDFTGVPAGRYVVGAVGGRPLFAELVSSGRAPVRLAVPRGRYLLTHVADGQARRMAEVDVTAGGTAPLDRLAWRESAGVEALRGPDLEAAGAFKQPFTEEAVSTLTVAYQAGRQPAVVTDARESRLSLSALWAPAPLGLSGAAWGLGARWTHVSAAAERWLVPSFAFGVGALIERSSHTADGGEFSLESYEGRAFLGPLWKWGATQIGLFLEGGGGPLLRRAAEGLAGDGFAPALGGAARAAYAWTRRWHLEVGVAAQERWVEIDGTNTRDGQWRAEAGVGWSLP
jgi:hypothetical protein